MNNITTNYLREIRKEKNISKQYLADQLNVTINLIDHWERGLKFISPTHLKQLGNILEVSLERILYNKKRKPLIIDNLNKASQESVIRLHKELIKGDKYGYCRKN